MYEAIVDELKERIDYDAVLSDLEPRTQGVRTLVRCPRCKHRSGWLLPGMLYIRCNRLNNCDKTAILGYIIGGLDAPKGDDFVRALDKACSLSGIPFERKEWSSGQVQNFERYQRRRDILDAVWSYAQERMGDFDCEGMAYAQERGWEEGFASRNFGYVGDVSSLAAIYDTAELAEIGLYMQGPKNDGFVPNPKWSNRLLFPVLDRTNKLRGFVGRTVNNAEPKYINTSGTSLIDALGIGINTAIKYQRIGLVEGPADVWKARQYGMDCLISVAGARFNADRLLALASLGINQVVVCFDTDTAGNAGLHALLDAADKIPDLDIFVISDLDGYKDPDELITVTGGCTRFRELFDSAIHGMRYRAKQWFADCRFGRTDGDRLEYVRRCTKYADSQQNAGFEWRIENYFLPEVCETSGLDPVRLIELRDAHREQLRLEANIKSRKNLLGELENAIQVNDFDQQSAVLKRFQELPSGLVDIYRSPLPDAGNILNAAETILIQMAQSEFIGIPNHTLGALDRMLLGLRGLVLLAGNTNVGKTILLGQLAVDCIRYNDEVGVIFASCEMPRHTIVQRIWSRLAGVPWASLRSAYAAQPNVEAVRRMREAEPELLEILERLRIIEARDGIIFDAATLYQEAQILKREKGCKRILVIADYLDVLPVPDALEGLDDIRQDKWRIKQMLGLRDALDGDPVIAVSEVRKKDGKSYGPITIDDVMGSARKSFGSDTVIIWNRWTDKMIYDTFDTAEFNNSGRLTRLTNPWDVGDNELKKPEVRKVIREIKFRLDELGRSFSTLQLEKVRDGARKGNIDITVYWETNDIVEGIDI